MLSFIAFDTETTSPFGAPHLVELGAVRVEDGEASDHFSRLVRPEVPVTPEAADVHGLTEDDLSLEPPAAEVLHEFTAWAGDALLIGHNVRADARVLGFEYARHALEAPAGPLACSLALARRCIPDSPDYKLATLIDHLGIEGDQEHRALPDASACWQVVEACIEEMGGWGGVTTASILEHASVPMTLRTAQPSTPKRHRAHVRMLERARLEGRSVVLLYVGEAGALARLAVTPRLLYQGKDRGYLEAECASSGLIKTYRLDRVRKLEVS